MWPRFVRCQTTWLFRLFCTICALTLAPAPASAWIQHGRVTRHAFAMTAWLDRYQSIPVTPYNYEDKDVYSPRWTIHYVEKNVGEETSAREILMYYSDEPDWGMDSANVSPFQLLMG
ncbi:MAG TPA: hypothetical protein DD435_15140, partial [Cyanobacteria bacterium UBA8530]|nr:hypothetical protein [Cyanobacteria bacterium UBA8530]